MDDALDALDALAFDDDRRRPSTVADETPSDGSDDAEDESTHDDRAERDAEEEALAAAAAKAAVAEAEAEAHVEEPAVKVDDAEKDEGSDENPDDVDHLVEEDPSETKTTPPGFEPETAKVAKVAKVDDDLAGRPRRRPRAGRIRRRPRAGRPRRCSRAGRPRRHHTGRGRFGGRHAPFRKRNGGR